MTPTRTEPPRPPRRYDIPLRCQQAAYTRARIVDAGADLLHGYPIWDWRPLTVPAVAELAGISTRTVIGLIDREVRARRGPA